KYTTLAQYADHMPAKQQDIFYLIGETREQIEHAPYLEAYRAEGQDVLLLTDPVDEFMTTTLREYKGKKLRAVDRVEPDKKEDESGEKETGEKFQGLLDRLKKVLGDEVKDVRLSRRLRESAACLVAGEGEASAHMERLMERLGRGEVVPPSKRVLEV